ncbi:lactoperoxidase-like isoform X2 [Lissotriton helveticus]
MHCMPWILHRKHTMAGVAYVDLFLVYLMIVAQLRKTGAAISDGELRDVDDDTIMKVTQEANEQVDQDFDDKIKLKLLRPSSAGPTLSEGAAEAEAFFSSPPVAITAGHVMGFFREAAGETSEAVRSGEKWQLISKKLNIQGIQDKDGNFYLTVNLSQEKLQRISQDIRCVTESAVTSCPKKDIYRSITGVCNHRENPDVGAANRAFTRWLPAHYEDGIGRPLGWTKGKPNNGFNLPEVRDVSNKIAKYPEKDVTLDSERSQIFMIWGQWVTHDIEFSPQGLADCQPPSCENDGNNFPVQIPPNDPSKKEKCMQFIRTGPACPTNSVVREQINGVTSFLDASAVYGSEDCQVRTLRDTTSQRGLLLVNKWVSDKGRAFLPYVNDTKNFCEVGISCLPVNPCPSLNLEHNVSCFIAGDRRANQNLGLLAINTIFVREHNRLARKLNKLNPHWEDEKLFQEARKIVGAHIQQVTYRDYLPIILGESYSKHLPVYHMYNEVEDPRIANVFSVAFRAPHTTISPLVYQLDSDYKPADLDSVTRFHKTLFAPWMAVKRGGFDPILRGLLVNEAKLMKQNSMMSDEVRERLFARNDSTPGLDLAAFDLQRSRDHGHPSYVKWRKFCGLSQPRNQDELAKVLHSKDFAKKLMDLYKTTTNIELWIAATAEPFVKNGRVGETLACLLGRQFQKLRDGDRLWWQNPGVFSKKQRSALSTISLSRIICDNSGLTEVPRDVFIGSEYPQGFVSCKSLNELDLSAWAETTPPPKAMEEQQRIEL